ncbi:MAG TPA: oligopeptide/dipeptide ABC transporter ATP-binding protein [Sedimentisphaerales bacterium]|nr:oligopeptide/dipeptide ABC transporter ATP-binding protein [Sedimentisphaerales bacterium]
MVSTNDYLLKVDDLKTYFPIRKGLLRRTVGYVKAVDGISFGIEKGQTLGLVGESGCGKTTVARSIVRLVPATAGKVVFEQRDILSAEAVELRRLRKEISLIFQDPYSSLNPRMTIGNIVGEPLKVQRKITNNELAERVAELLSKVGLSPDYMNRYPHEFSGGQRQRIGIARALTLRPKLVICDEPVSALDVSIQSQILNLLKDLQEEFGLTFLFIAHDLTVVEFFCDVVAVMYMGRIVEQATAKELYRNPLHPYTCGLISAVPAVERSGRSRRTILGGEVPSVLNRFPQGGVPPSGCPFHPRCPRSQNDCLEQMPALKRGKNTYDGHFVACWKC